MSKVLWYTNEQFRIHAASGHFAELITVGIHRRFHWAFWRPMNCIGGRVYLGTYWEVFIK
jgi:hypothetical protein